MRTFPHNRNWLPGPSRGLRWSLVRFLVVFLASPPLAAFAQASNQDGLTRQIQELTDAIARTQARLDQSQLELDQMRKQLSQLQAQMGQSTTTAQTPAPSVSPQDSSSASPQDTTQSIAAAIQDIREHQVVEESQIATHEQSKVESESKYPVKVTGMLLMNGFVNTSAVDIAATPTLALPGSGSAGASVRQTILGLNARGPHLFGARSFADLRMDLYGSSAPSLTPTSYSTTTSYNGYYNSNAALLRLRTVHAGLDWDKTQAYFSIDRPIIIPETPTSLTAVAEPSLAWSGNLWTWNPQAGITQNVAFPGSYGTELQAALIDTGDAPLSQALALTGTPATPTAPNTAEQSSRPGVEARIALFKSGQDEDRSQIGFGGFFAPHRIWIGQSHESYDSWAATFDARIMLFSHLQFSGSAYRGLALGGLGGGTYKDFVYSPTLENRGYYFRALEDVGGWAQLKEKVSERLEFNAAYGMDNVFAGQLRPYFVSGGSIVQNLAINRTYTGNVIYSPSAYLLFSLEYRHLESLPVIGLPAQSNIIGLGAGYKF